ncbi:uncharacterized protein ACB058_001052 isoform 2-T2 [Synchiropus picturatus]
MICIGTFCQCSRGRMACVKSLVTLVMVQWAAVSGQQPDVTVHSRYMRDQILPCSFPSGDVLVVHWSKERKDDSVHSYNRGKIESEHQMDQFRGRTFLFDDQLSRGNASLLLKKVQVSDHGRYTCYTSNSRGRQESSVNLEVEAPVTKVSIVQEGDTITCSSEGIYPEPQVTWSRNKTADTRIEQTEQLLYNIRSSVRADDECDFTCHVRTLRSSRRATLTIVSSITLSGAENTLDCPALKSPVTSVTWWVNDSIIVQSQLIISERWRDHVKDLSMSGSLTLRSLTPDHGGIYTCEVTNEEETQVKIINVTIAETRQKATSWWIILLIVLGVAGLVVAGLVALLLFDGARYWRSLRDFILAFVGHQDGQNSPSQQQNAEPATESWQMLRVMELVDISNGHNGGTADQSNNLRYNGNSDAGSYGYESGGNGTDNCESDSSDDGDLDGDTSNNS